VHQISESKLYPAVVHRIIHYENIRPVNINWKADIHNRGNIKFVTITSVLLGFATELYHIKETHSVQMTGTRTVTPVSGIFLEKLIASQSFKKFPEF
jgi:hypothetical protein